MSAGPREGVGGASAEGGPAAQPAASGSVPPVPAPARPGNGLPHLLRRARRTLRAQIDRAEQRREERRQVVLRLEPGTVIAPASMAVAQPEPSPDRPVEEPDGAEPRTSPLDSLPSWLVRGGIGAWLLLGILIVVSLAVFATSQIVPVFIGIFIALVVTSLLEPVVDLLARVMPRYPATFLALLGALGVVAGLVTYVVTSVTNQWSSLARQFSSGVTTILDFLENGPLPLHLTQQELVNQFHSWLEKGQRYVESNAPTLASEVLSNAGTVVEVFTVLALALFCTIFFLASGGRMWRWFLNEMPTAMRPRVHRAAGAGWYTFAGYARGTMIVALTDAMMAGAFLQVIGIPLAAPLAVLVFIGAFIPIVGAPAAMIVAMIVALASKGLVMAIVVGLGVAGIGQIEGHILQPLIMGRQVSLHPVVVIIAVAVGTYAAGLLGAIVAVPVVSVAWSVYSVLHTKDAPVQGELPRFQAPR
ncbi:MULTISPECIES: AI-2E family transporter [unclassified Actinomyces]|uniref:AI-2E family transporter n=1 Tax=unclassified Actinomyces TaxID=2609248 RepID=UPI0020171AA9|nr:MULTISPECIES: AI-2E family transporter [unclassified Actinomyces]